MTSNKFFILLIVMIYGTVAVMTVFVLMLPAIYGQGTPTTIQGNANSGALRFVPQDAIVVTKSPEGFVSNDFGSQGGIWTTIAAVAGLGTAIYGKISGDKKGKELEEKDKAITQTQVKIVGVQEGTLEQVYENMPQKGNEITNKPVIKLSNVKEIKDEALKNASKA